MPIISGLCNSYKLETMQGVHDLRVDTVKAALYTAAATLTPNTTAYSASNEATGTNWAAGGVALPLLSGYPKLVPGVDATNFWAAWAWQDVLVADVTVTYRAILLYNASKANRAICVVDRGVDEEIVAGPIILFWNSAAGHLVVHA